MADPIENTIPAVTPGTEAQPTVVAEPVVAAPAVVATKPGTVVAPGKRKPQEVRIPLSGFKARLDREAANIIKKRLGCTLDEAEAIVKAKQPGAAAVPAAGAAPAAVANEGLVALQAQLTRVQRQATDALKKAGEWEAKHKKDTARLRDRAIENELKALAAVAGATDADYAIHLFARAAASGQATDPATYFGVLKTSHPHLFGTVQAAAPAPKPAEPVKVPASTAPPASNAAGEATPTPNPAGGAKPAEGVEGMSQQDFSRRTRATYGFTPSM